jgi:hypothetical protein
LVKARHRVLVLALCVICLLLPGVAGQGQQGIKTCPKPYIKFISPPAGRPGAVVCIRGERFGMPPGKVIFENENKLEGFFFGEEAKGEIVYWTLHRIWVRVPKSAAASCEVYVRVSCGAESTKVKFIVRKE